MKVLENAILEKGTILPGDILKVDSFLNLQIDVKLCQEMGKEFYNHFKDCGVNKILTIEASGIGIACVTAQFFDCNVLFAKKSQTSNMGGDDCYLSEAWSYTHQSNNIVRVPKKYLSSEDRVLIIDDFMAKGAASNALIDIVNKSGATLCGVGICVEKGFQGGGDSLRDKKIDVYSLAIIDRMENDGTIIFRD